jgi:predicted nucleic acid-binding protein
VIVVDTNTIAYLMLRGVHTAAVEAVYAADNDWRAPLLWRGEFRHVLVKEVRDGRTSAANAVQIMARAEAMMRGREHHVSSEQVLRLGLGSKCSAYDCEFVALAEDLGVALVTSDRDVLRAFPSLSVSPADFVA